MTLQFLMQVNKQRIMALTSTGKAGGQSTEMDIEIILQLEVSVSSLAL